MLIGCRKEEWRKDEVYSLSSEVLIICDQPHQRWYSFKGKLGETTERRGRACMGLSEHCDAILSWNWKLKASHSGTVDSMNMDLHKATLLSKPLSMIQSGEVLTSGACHTQSQKSYVPK